MQPECKIGVQPTNQTSHCVCQYLEHVEGSPADFATSLALKKPSQTKCHAFWPFRQYSLRQCQKQIQKTKTLNNDLARQE